MNCPLLLKAKGTLNSFILSIIAGKHTSSTRLPLSGKTGQPPHVRCLQKNQQWCILLLNLNKLLQGKAHRSVNQHTHSSKAWQTACQSLTACILPSSSSWFGLGTSFKMLKISSLLALFLIAIVKQSATVYPGRDPEQKQKQKGQKYGKASKGALVTSVCLAEKQYPSQLHLKLCVPNIVVHINMP